MPELPEVETVARQLAPCLVGRTVQALRIYDPRLRNGRTPLLSGSRVTDVRRSGKRVLIELQRGSSPLYLAVHLRMTGRLLWSEEAFPRRHLRARFALDRGALGFVDARRFGTFDWYERAADAEPEGMDPLSRHLDARTMSRLLATTQNVKAWLLRQDRLTGLGNIYASEILYAARIDPRRPAGSLDPQETRALLTATRRILRRAIRACGTTFSDFQDARGVEGSYQAYLAVYGREGERCRRCAGTVRRIVQQQRSTFFCPECQR